MTNRKLWNITVDHNEPERPHPLRDVNGRPVFITTVETFLQRTINFRIYDDDDILYFEGWMHEGIEDDFAPLNWAMADSGATRIDLQENGKWVTL